MTDTPGPSSVMVTGATGFVGRYIVHELLSRGITPVCLVRSASKLLSQHPEEAAERIQTVVGGISNRKALAEAASASQAVIHLVGIIIARPLRGQTFHRIHVRGTQNVIEAARNAGIRRFLHMSALGTRPNAVSEYHRTKWQAEEAVRAGGLDWTIFRPSVIHGPEGEFMQLMKRFICALFPPVIPFFGSGQARIQPVYVRDVARCFVESLFREQTIRNLYPLGGPRAYSWVEFYETCREIMLCAKKWKPLVSQPVSVAKVIATLGAPFMALVEMFVPKLGLFRFDRGQVQMSQDDSVCDTEIAERTFGIHMAPLEDTLAVYADQIL